MLHTDLQRKRFLRRFTGFSLICALCASLAQAEGAHGLAMHGAPALPPDFAHLPYANPDAPRGGRFAIGVAGTFDSLNPYILRGRAPAEIRAHTVESLLARNWDEPFALYGWLAETVETPPDRSWVVFRLRPEARFSDGSPVTAADVLWSFETLAEVGRPNFRAVWSKVDSAEAPDDRTVRVVFSEPDREAPLILGLTPILKAGQALAEPGLTPLIGSGPYVVAAVEPGRSLILRRNPDWWGADVPAMRGQNNFDEIAVEYFRDAGAHFDAFRAGQIDLFRETDPNRWAQGYDFARMRDGRAVKAEIAHGRPTGMTGLAMNARRAPFDDIRVRRALMLAFNFEWVNATLRGGVERRITAYFDNSDLRHRGAAEGRERAILEPFADVLPAGALDAEWAPPAAEAGDPRNRRNLRAAARLLEEAGWTVQGGALRDGQGRPFAFEILLGSSAEEATAGAFRDALATLGIAASVRTVDAAQYQARLNDYDYDMIVARWGMSLSPGNEQRLYWGRQGVTEPGTRNYPGVDSPAVEAAIDALLTAEADEDFRAAARALDRALAHGEYVIPFGWDPVSRIAHDAGLRRPERTPLYGDWIGWAPEVWWRE
ncbi:MAG: extracellular solute-binding protein [Rubrimonas sp.]